MSVGTNADFRAFLDAVERQIDTIEGAYPFGCVPRVLAPELDALKVKRTMLRTLLVNRRIQAAKPVVDFAQWRDGNGALYMIPQSPQGDAGEQRGG